MLSPEEVEELKTIGINIEALTYMVKSQYELLKPVTHNIYYSDAEKRHEMALNQSLTKITKYAQDALAKSKKPIAEDVKQ